jgi:transglutaminase-like putative cysteine protease
MSEAYETNVAPPDSELRSEWIVRLAVWCVRTWRPYLGWLVLFLCIGLSTLPALLMAENHWLLSPALEGRLLWLGPLAIATVWLVGGWRVPYGGRALWLRRALQLIFFLAVGFLLLMQVLGEWLPSLGDWWRAFTTGAWPALRAHVVEAWGTVFSRYVLWWQGVQQNSAARDDLILAGIAGAAIWLLAGATAYLARRFRQGLLAGLPILWPVGFIMLYSPIDRWLFVTAVALTLALHLLLDQQALVSRWQAQQLDYSPSLLVERGLTALSGMALALVVASLMPNLYVYDVTARYYEWLQPANARMEALGKRLFPGLTGVVPWQLRGVAGGMPNAFLLGAGTEPGRREVMRVRTNEPVYGYNEPPLGHPLRGGTFADYGGLGWDNLAKPNLTSFAADAPWRDLSAARRPLLQSVNLAFNSSVIYAAGEPESVSIPYVTQERFPGDLIALTSRARSYTAASQIPALDEAELNALPAWDAQNPLPPEYNIYLALPDTVTPRTRDLAAQLTSGQPTMYAQAGAIEAYLREIPYDLSISAPPEGITDVADYFLFDLRRGYCDYYATAFVVLARIAGLPARFVTGFAPGNWLLGEQQWIITEAEAHSWPEVYFPEVGWVRFEPTAYRPPAPRIGLPESFAGGGTVPAFEPLPPPSPLPGWLPLWWAALALVPAAAVIWGVATWRRGREDPWQSLLRWGQKAGRPLGEGETTLEYGRSLADYVQEKHGRAGEVSRTAAREVQALSDEVSGVQYAPQDERQTLRQQAIARWSRLRQYLRRLR